MYTYAFRVLLKGTFGLFEKAMILVPFELHDREVLPRPHSQLQLTLPQLHQLQQTSHCPIVLLRILQLSQGKTPSIEHAPSKRYAFLETNEQLLSRRRRLRPQKSDIGWKRNERRGSGRDVDEGIHYSNTNQ